MPASLGGTVADITGAPAHTYRDWALDHADDFRVLTTPEIADRYIAAFRTSKRVAPFESGGEPAAGRITREEVY